MESFDALVIGAGAAGLFAAGIAGQRGLRVLLVDHAPKIAEKIRISGGGRCNFTNREVGPGQFLSANRDFCRSALARYTSRDFIGLVERHRIAFHEKHRGQLFCDGSSEQIIQMLLRECDAGQVIRRQPCSVQGIRRREQGFEVDTDAGPVTCGQVVIATGGLSIPKIGATDFGHRWAQRFGHRLVEPRPALVPLTFDTADWEPFAGLAGLSLEVAIGTGKGRGRGHFVEDLLFTHRGLSGPAVLQISSYWAAGDPLQIDLAPGVDLRAGLRDAKSGSHRKLANQLGEWLPNRLAQAFAAALALNGETPMPECRDRDLDRLAQALTHWQLTPTGSEGWRKAEVTAGGVDTRDLDGGTMQSRLVPGLYFIGEVVDVTGWLGGYNFQWAWASGHACALALSGNPVPV